MKIYYLIPDAFQRRATLYGLLRSIKKYEFKAYLKQYVFPQKKPLGGVKVILQHCVLLKTMGFNVTAVRMGEYEGNFFNYDLNIEAYSTVVSMMNDDDLVVIPEVIQNKVTLFPRQKKILFAQAWSFLYQLHPIDDQKVFGSYFDIGFNYILTCSDYIHNYFNNEPQDNIIQVKNFIDHKVFQENPLLRKTNRLLFMPRKNKKDIDKIIAGISHLPIEIAFADGLSQEELVIEYQKSDYFVATGYPEGFGLPPLEAMACGCVVIGFTGRGADEYMIHNDTALVAQDGDTETVVMHIKNIINNNVLKERIRLNGVLISKKYNINNTSKQLSDFYNGFISP